MIPVQCDEGVCVQFSKQKIQSLEKVIEMKTSKNNDTLAAAQKGLTHRQGNV